MNDQLFSVRKIHPNEQFCFNCHPGAPCFTECCRQLDLLLSPYDVLRLKRRLAISSSVFLERYAIIERQQGAVFPVCALAMVDDGKASCVFVDQHGCQVYADRPGSCRTYPLARGVACLGKEQKLVEELALVREAHCRGFEEPQRQQAAAYLELQGMAQYTLHTDALLPLLQHQRVLSKQFSPTAAQAHQFILALYDLDRFRRMVNEGRISIQGPLDSRDVQGLAGDDEALLLLALRWLRREFFGD